MLITLENIQYHVEIRGTGFPLVCLHGFSEDGTTWDDIHIDGYALIMIDLIGHGKSDKPTQEKPYTLPYMLSHLHAIIHTFVSTPYSLLGYSLGGRIALSYALTYPQELKALILESASYGIEKEEDRIERYKNDAKLADTMCEQGIEWFQEYWSKLPIFASQQALSQIVQEKIAQRRLHNTAIALANTLRGSGQGVMPCLKNMISTLPMPTLYICGELDEKYCQIGQEFYQLNPTIRYASVQNAGHNVHVEQPDAFTKLLTAFLRDQTNTKHT